MRPRKAVSPHRPECALLVYFVCGVCQIACVLCHTLSFAVDCTIATCQGGSVCQGHGRMLARLRCRHVSQPVVRMRLLLHGRLFNCCGAAPAVRLLPLSCLTPRGHMPSARLLLCAVELSWIPFCCRNPLLMFCHRPRHHSPTGCALLPHPATSPCFSAHVLASGGHALRSACCELPSFSQVVGVLVCSGWQLAAAGDGASVPRAAGQEGTRYAGAPHC